MVWAGVGAINRRIGASEVVPVAATGKGLRSSGALSSFLGEIFKRDYCAAFWAVQDPLSIFRRGSC